MENLNQVLALIEPIINPDGGMQYLTNVRALRNWHSNPGKVL